jgi:DNA-binding NtrC family response regulator
MNKRVERIASETMSALCNYHWPGNIRELQKVLERAAILSSGPVLRISRSDLSADGGLSSKQSHPAKPESEGEVRRSLEPKFWGHWAALLTNSRQGFLPIRRVATALF